MRALLDANVLLALGWASHPHHEAAERWFRNDGGDDWATCLFTQSAFIRLSLNPRVVQFSAKAETVMEALAGLVSQPGHAYLSASPSLTDGSFDQLAGKLIGHRQVTDATLLHVARSHGAALATFDGAIAKLSDRPEDVLVVPSA